MSQILGLCVTLTLALVAIPTLVISASAAPLQTDQNERGAFIQEQSGAWHRYNRGNPLASLEYAVPGALDRAKGSIY